MTFTSTANSPGSSSNPRRSGLDRLFEGTTSPSAKAYNDIFGNETSTVDTNLATLCTFPATTGSEEPSNGLIHKVLYKGDEVWRVEPQKMALTLLENEDRDRLHKNFTSNRRYESTCIMIQDAQQLEFSVESILSPVASEREVEDEISAAPTSVWCNTSNGCHDAVLSTTHPELGVVIFRESRKISVESLIRASAEAYQRLSAAVPEREAQVIEYYVPSAQHVQGVTDTETSDASEYDEIDIGRDEKAGNRQDFDTVGVVKTSVSMTSDSSSVYLNQEDDELSAQQQEMVRAFGGVGCFVNVA
ncbi:hypothetical protein IV203_017024 [Nitzschia inconspicua]|uniref:Uncharacterized protein n=1 Tax=Nitzschia inconspicua TaxID=303405 RepID=A0A9K3KQY9_9STRA|nr:hypothetical protein IV203_017024 [Nitzschia inconspicua]